jgi:glutaredoxin-related protein
MNLVDMVEKQVELNPNVLYLEGTPDSPVNPVTRQVVEALTETGVAYAHVDIDANSEMGKAVERITGESRFPQLFIGGKYAGRAVIILAMHHDGKLEKFMNEAVEAFRLQPGSGPKV